MLIGLIVIPILRYLKVGQSEREDGPKSHLKKSGTPTMGGIMMAIGIIGATIFAFIYYIGSEPEVGRRLIPLIGASIGFGLIGFIDDFKKVILRNTDGLSPSKKMFGLLIISILYVIYLNRFSGLGTDILIPFANKYVTLPVFIYIPFCILVMLGTTNAINLTDGVDGLAATITLIIVTTLTSIGIIYDVKEIIIYGSIICGTCLGFLSFNLNKAKVFMGDTGSLLLGGVVSCCAIYLKMPILLLIIAAVPVAETLSVILQVSYYKKTKKRIFKMAPLHHHFELSGWKENKIVSVFGGITLVLCIIGIFSVV
ncbi:MAG: phospho-N-acetylmuramoyl-pentapeptide-transferase [Clostridia bacterium]|nr:phospho-N-acetylmuramoyl-pentapeptide-transferase [Clostridia bacterium]